MQIKSIDLGQRRKGSSKEKEKSFQQMMQEQLGIYIQKCEPRYVPEKCHKS